LDEAQSYLPQDVKDSIISDPEARDALLNAYMRTIAIGGSLGLFPVILTQRIAQTNKKIIGQPELLFLFKQTLDNDLNRYKDFTNVSAEKVRALKQGHGIFVDYEGQSTIHKFHKRTSLLKKSLQSLRENLSLLVHSMAEGINKQKVDKEYIW
jgi:hypothetical protein